MVAGAVILPKDCEILFLNDSKKLSEKKREELFVEIQEKAIAWNVGIVGPDVIDEINILQATYEAMRQAIAGLSVQPELLLNDAVTIPGVEIQQIPIVKGDAKSVSIAAASIMAKVTRDHMMMSMMRCFRNTALKSIKDMELRHTERQFWNMAPVPFTEGAF